MPFPVSKLCRIESADQGDAQRAVERRGHNTNRKRCAVSPRLLELKVRQRATTDGDSLNNGLGGYGA